MSDQAIGGLAPFEWDRRDAARYQAAVEAIDEAVACYTRLRNRAVAAGRAEEAERLYAGQAACVAEQQRLRVEDRAAVERVLTEYPALIEWLRDRIG